MTKTRIAVIVTFLWIIIGTVVIAAKFDSISGMPLNEIGDFLAGFFSPVAFMWLVVGYFQQGEELKLNTRALELQVTELKMSVEQQRELVEVTRADMALTKQTHEMEVAKNRRLAQPVIQLQIESYQSILSGLVSIDVTISNHGHSATSLFLKCTSGTVSPDKFPVIASSQNKAINISLASPSWEFDFDIDYLDGLEQRKRQTFTAVISEQGHLVFLPPKEIYLTDV